MKRQIEILTPNNAQLEKRANVQIEMPKNKTKKRGVKASYPLRMKKEEHKMKLRKLERAPFRARSRTT